MRSEITRGVLCLLLPLALALACDAGQTSGHGSSKEQLGKAPLDDCPRFVDEDGDGYFAADDTGCEGATPHWESAPDCDDSDPKRTWSESYFEDADGDGHGDPQGEERAYCYGDVVPGFVPNADDCAPDDPDRYYELYLDADGDGVGGELECPVHDSPKHTAWSGDCDDANPSVNPNFGTVELALDGVDSDCDGDDAPLVACDASPEIAVPDGASCSGVGLAFLARSECQGKCGGGTGVVSIVNMGSEASPSATLHITREGAGIPGQELTIPALEPGEIFTTSSLELYAELVIELPSGGANCAPEPSTRTHLNGNYNAC